MRPVYIVGDNILTSLGLTTTDVIQNISSGTRGVRHDNNRLLTPASVPLSLVNSIKLCEKFREVLAIRHAEFKEEQFTRLEKMFIVSVHNAMRDSDFDHAIPNSLLIISSTKGNIDLLEDRNKNFSDPTRFYLWKMAQVIGSFFGFVNQPVVISNACISGVLAISTATRLIETGRYDNVVVAGGDILSEFVISGFLSFQALSQEPCKPFDAGRDGLSLGEGCGTLILSSNRPGSRSIVVSGSSTTNDANHISGPSRTGEELAMAISKAMNEARVTPGEISFISAHGTGTLYNDEMESKAIEIAGLQKIPVNSFKGYWGHTLGAAGVIESIATIRSMEMNLLIKSAGFKDVGVSVPVNVVCNNMQTPVHNSLKIASGFGGCNAAVIFCKR